MLAKIFPELGEEVSTTRLGLRTCSYPWDSPIAPAAPGNLVTVSADIHLPPDVHVYAPGTKGYKPIRLVIDRAPRLQNQTSAVLYPRSKILYLPVIKERVPRI